jgi:hypothetical protein
MLWCGHCVQHTGDSLWNPFGAKVILKLLISVAAAQSNALLDVYQSSSYISSVEG